MPSGEMGEGNHLNNVLNLYRMSREGEGGIVNFLHGGVDLFWNYPFLHPDFAEHGSPTRLVF